MKELVIKSGETNISVSVDGEQIGCIQSIVFKASVDGIRPEIQITFPDLSEFDSTIVDENINKLKDVPNVSILIGKSKEWNAGEMPNDPSELAKWDGELTTND